MSLWTNERARTIANPLAEDTPRFSEDIGWGLGQWTNHKEGAGLLGVGVTIRGRGGQRERTGTERRKGLFLSSEPGPG